MPRDLLTPETFDLILVLTTVQLGFGIPLFLPNLLFLSDHNSWALVKITVWSGYVEYMSIRNAINHFKYWI